MATMNKKIRIPFTEEEVNKIKETPLENLRDLAFFMDRSYSSVRRKKWALENKEHERNTRREYSKKLTRKYGPFDEYNIWTVDEENMILTSKLSDSQIAQKLNRTIGSIQTKRYRLLQEKKKKAGKKNAGTKKSIKKTK